MIKKRPIIKKIFNSPNSENFKNVVRATSWTSYLSPLNNLLTLLEGYLKPGIVKTQPSLPRLLQALTPARALIAGETAYQKGLVARAVSTAADQLKREAHKTVREFSGPSAPLDSEVSHHPLVKISRLIGMYKTHGDDYLPVSRENHLSSALRHLDQKMGSFRGVEAFVYGKIKDGTLHQNLDALVQSISIFIESNGDDKIYQFLYHKANERGEIGYFSRSHDTQAQIAWGKQHLKNLETLSANEKMARFEKLWVAAAEHDEITGLEELVSSMSSDIADPTHLSQSLDKAIRFFQSNPSTKLSKDVLGGIANVTSGWLSLVYSWMGDHLESSELNDLEKRLNHLQQQMNKGNHLQALVKLKEELQKSPLAKKMHESSDSVSPLNTLQQTKEKLANALSKGTNSEKASWEESMELEKERLVNQVGYLSTFKTIYNVFGAPQKGTDPIAFQKQSDTAYAHIMNAVDKAPAKEQQTVFLNEMKEAIDNRDDISFFRKVASKLTCWIVMIGVRFFTKHFTHSFINYLTKTISLPTQQPLSTIHLSPVERINDCFVAQKKALSKWGNDEQGEEFGAMGRKKAMEVALRNPDLNNGYEHDELVDRTTRCAIDQFLNVEGLSSTFFSMNKHIENWTNKGTSTIGYGIKLFVSLVPQIVVTAGYLEAQVLEWAGSKILKVLAKQFMTRLNIVNIMLDSMKDSLYKQSQYTQAIDGLLLEQLQEVEKLLENGGGEAIEHEGEEAKKLFKEAVANAVHVIDLNRNLTTESLKAAQESPNSALGEAALAAKKMADEQLRNAIVQLLIIVYQSVLTEDQMNGLILKIFKATNDNLFPQTVIQMYYSETEKEAIEKKLGHKASDLELKKEFAFTHGKKVEDLTDTEIQTQMKVKYNKTEQALRETTFRVIKKSVHQVVKEEGKSALMSANQAVVSYIDFMDRCLFENTTSRSTNFFRKSEELIQAFETASSKPAKKQALEKLHAESVSFLREYESKQRLLDQKVNGKDRTAAHMRRMNEISNSAIMPRLVDFQETMKVLIRDQDEVASGQLRISLKALYDNVYKNQAEFQQIKQEEIRLQSQGETFSEKARIFGNKVIKHGAPVALDQVELYANHRLNQIAEGAFHLYKDSNVFESFLRHVVMLNFVESSGYKKG